MNEYLVGLIGRNIFSIVSNGSLCS